MPRTPSTVGRDLLLLIGLPFSLMIGLIIWAAPWELPPPYTPPGGDIHAAVSGRWTWSTDTGQCSTAWHDVAFDSARRTMAIHYSAADQGGDAADQVYHVQESAPDRVMTLLEGDLTIGEDGTQAVWILILTSDTSYVWRRRDWMPGRVTAPNFRCAAPST
jgi:hypothetical protein